jgi:hypothetical protein
MDVATRAVESVKAQTVACASLVYQDDEGRGAGYARNRLLEAVKTPLVAFLDADDTIDPQFAEYCIRVWGTVAGKHYIYTNWKDGERVHRAAAPCDMWTTVRVAEIPSHEDAADFVREGNMWVRKTWHVVTTVIPTEYARRIGGFDENMTALEDVDFYKRLTISGVCGVHVNAALFNYRSGGQRSIDARVEKDESGLRPEEKMMLYMSQRYGGFTMGCCGDNHPIDTNPGEKMDGDVLAQAQWQGNRRERGTHSGRLYPRASFPKVIYMDPLDIAKRPDLWKRVSSAQTVTNPILQPGYQRQPASLQSVANLAFGGGQPQQQSAPVQSSEFDYNKLENMRTTTDILKIARRK